MSNSLTNSPTISAATTPPPSAVPATTTTIGIQEPAKKAEQKTNPVEYYVKFSFTITYILLLTTGTITFIEALRTPFPAVRHVMNLETCISVVAGYFYSTFVAQIDKYNEKGLPIDWADITKTRYIDWSITTPMMLLVLSLVLSQNINKHVEFTTLMTIFLLNYIMLYVGYLGETNVLGRIWAMILGYVPFAAMFYLIFVNFVKPKYVLANYVLFGTFLGLWTLYGLVYMFDENYKNIAMNVLDLTAKCFVGIGLWAYYAKIVYV